MNEKLKQKEMDYIEFSSKPDQHLKQFQIFCANRNFVFSTDILRRYYTSLKTKPFVILSGISGTGKTKIAKLFTEFITNSNKEQYEFISVRPDWMDNRGILGYHNIITDKYESTPFLDILLRADKDYKENKKNAKPYFIILDEMNLAKVEYYFSDFLSCLESRMENVDGEIVQDAITLHSSTNKQINSEEIPIPRKIEIPLNIYFTGTVNIDETTSQFSPKVLDRANVIEFNDVNVETYKKNPEKTNKIQELNIKELSDYFTNKGKFITLKPSKKDSNISNIIYLINNILKKYNLHFGYRILDEINVYFQISENFSISRQNREKIIDEQIAQKILPKFTGDTAKLQEGLSHLNNYLSQEIFYNYTEAITLESLKRMLNDLESKGFTSGLY